MNLFFNEISMIIKTFKERVNNEIKAVSQDYICKKKVHCYPEAEYAAWIGGSILTSLNTFENLWVTKADYKEVGSTIIHRKCV